MGKTPSLPACLVPSRLCCAFNILLLVNTSLMHTCCMSSECHCCPIDYRSGLSVFPTLHAATLACSKPSQHLTAMQVLVQLSLLTVFPSSHASPACTTLPLSPHI